jgi:hypothetical protein
MSTVLVVTPILIASWPAISAAVSAAIATMGFTIAHDSVTGSSSTQSGMSREEIEVDDSEILADAVGTDEKIIVEREGIRATFSRDARGGLRLCMEGHGMRKSQLRELGEELLGRVTQQYAYHRIVTELKDRNMTIVDEQMTEESSVKIRVRNW